MSWLDSEFEFPVIVLISTGLFLGLLVVLARRAASLVVDKPIPSSRSSDSIAGDGDFDAGEPLGRTARFMRQVLAVLKTLLVLATLLLVADFGAQWVLALDSLENTLAFRLRAWTAVIVLTAALPPAVRPSLRRIMSGALLGVAVSIALTVVWVFALGELGPLAPALVLNLIGASVISIVAAVGAGLISGALLRLAGLVRDEQTRQVTVAGVVGLGLVLVSRFVPLPALEKLAAGLGAGVIGYALIRLTQLLTEQRLVRTAFMSAIVLGTLIAVFQGFGLLSRVPVVDPGYRLKPSTWRGEMLYGMRRYPFLLVVEKVDSTGQFTGYMDWAPAEYRTRIEGKAKANHLVFEDTGFLRGQSETGLFDRKDTWIERDAMKGTDKNGRAYLTANLVPEPSPAKAVPPPPALQALVPPPPVQQAVAVPAPPVQQAMVAPPIPEVPQYPQVAPPEPAPRTELTKRTERLCAGIAKLDGRYGAGCWTTQALETRRSTYCDLIGDAGARANCFSLVASLTGDPSACHALGPDGLEACVVAAAAARGQAICDAALPAQDPHLRAACKIATFGNAGNCAQLSNNDLAEKCKRAVTTIAEDRAAVGSLAELAFYRDYSARELPSARERDACKDSSLGDPPADICRLERLRRSSAKDRCEGFDEPERADLCKTIIRP